ncbi:MAG: hypothetical protein WEB88_17045 [Gemmatimonadota bacterium]
MMVIRAASGRTRAVAFGLLAVTFLVGGLSGMALQQTRRAASAVPPAEDVLMVPFGTDGEMRACPAPRQTTRDRFAPLDSIGASPVKQDSIGRIMDAWRPKLRAVWRQYDEIQDSLYAQFDTRSDAVRDSMQVETRAVLTPEERTALEALYERQDSTHRAMRRAQKAFEEACIAARRTDRGQEAPKDSGNDR